MTAHPIDRDRLDRLVDQHGPDHHGPDHCGARDCFTSCVWCDEEWPCPTVDLARLLAAAEARATRAEAQSEARRINAAYWKERARIMGRKRDAGVRELADVQTERNNALTRIKAVRDVHNRWAVTGSATLPRTVLIDIRRALNESVPRPQA